VRVVDSSLGSYDGSKDGSSEIVGTDGIFVGLVDGDAVGLVGLWVGPKDGAKGLTEGIKVGKEGR
jgi:hypothetical protein